VRQQNEDFSPSNSDLLQTVIPPGSAYVMIQSLMIFCAWTDENFLNEKGTGFPDQFFKI